MNFIQEFIEHMQSSGWGPLKESEIIPDDVKRRYAVIGDKGGKKSAVYQLRLDGDFACGWYHSFKEGVTHKWHSKSKRKISDEERKEIHRKIDAQRKKQEREIKKGYEKAARIAVKRWATCTNKGTTEYLERKKIELLCARIYKDSVYVPMYFDNKIVNLQKIYPDGRKRFIKYGIKQGCYGFIASADDDKSVIYICEGYATAQSVRYACVNNPVIIAFDAGNLQPVAEKIRLKYPDAKIVICADNDQWTKKPDGTAWNPGLEKARKAAAVIRAFCIWPEVSADDPHRTTDFNDVHCNYGIEQVRDRLDSVGDVQNITESDASQVIPLSAYDEDEGHIPTKRDLGETVEQNWQSMVIEDKYGNLKSSSMHNMKILLEYHPEFKGMFAYDEFAHQMMLVRCPPWEKESEFRVQRVNDTVITEMSMAFECHGLSSSVDKTFKAVQVACKKNAIHPAREYISKLEWDGVPRLDRWLKTYAGCVDAPDEYLDFVGTKWLVAAVKRVFEPGCKFDHILVFEGNQGIGKSTLLKELATFEDESYFNDDLSITDIGDKDMIMKIQGAMILEIPEMQGFNKKDDTEIKKWITVQVDECRLPYGRTIEYFPRQFVIGASTNEYDYLRDMTGNRRYWPVLATKIDIDKLREDRLQLWAEALTHYRDGMYIGPTHEEAEMAKAEQAKRLKEDIWEEAIMHAVDELNDKRMPVKVNSILQALGVDLKDRNVLNKKRVENVLKKGGYEQKVRKFGEENKSHRCWIK